MAWRSSWLAALVAAAAAAIGSAGESAAAMGSPRRLAPTPDEMIDAAIARMAGTAEDALAEMLWVTSLAPEASADKSRRALAGIGSGRGPAAEEARWLARRLEPEASPSAAPPRVQPLDEPLEDGLVRTLSLLGPLDNMHGGLETREGLETPDFDFRSGLGSRGALRRMPLRSTPISVTARGVPLDRHIHPRAESCTYLASSLRLARSQRIAVRVAATGSVRLMWDGRDAIVRTELHRRAIVDRAAVVVDASQGRHLLSVKVCSGALGDEGRVRLRVTSVGGEPLEVRTSSDPGELQLALDGARRSPADAVHAMPTLYERAVALGDSPTPEGSLRAALVRVLAGADDLQSPAAPGMLALLAARPDIDAETLATVAYLAPFGANRSGWLHRAHALAEREGAAGARAFVQRVLVLSLLGSQQPDAAHSLAGLPPLAQALDAQAIVIRAEVLARLGGEGFRRAAITLLEQLVRRDDAATPEAALRALAQLTRGSVPTTHLDALRRLVRVAPGYRGPTYVSAHAIEGASAMVAVARRDVAVLTHAGEIDGIAQALLEAGEAEEAARLFELATVESPNRVPSHLGRARALQSLPRLERSAIEEALSRARALEPGEANIGAELAFRSGKRGSLIELGEDARWLVASSEFLARARAHPLNPTAEVERQLHWRRIVRMLDDRRVAQTIHYAREIGLEPRTDDEQYETVPEAGPTSELLLARVHRSDGTVLPPEEQDATGARIRWPRLRRGDVIEIAVRSFTPGPVGRRGDVPFYFVDYVGSAASRPVLYNEVVIDAPEGSPLAFDVLGGEPDRTLVSREHGRTVTRLVWDAPPSLAGEPHAPPPSESLPVVVGSIHRTWKDFLDWYRGAVEGFADPDDQIRQVARELTASARSRDERIEALFRFVADDIRYVNYTSGEWWLPNRPQHLLARRQGDCDDKANLLIALLRAEGIEAVEVLVQTRHTAQPRILLESRIAVPLFDHGIVFLPNEHGGRYLDPTSPHSLVDVLPAMDSDAVALLVTDGPSRPIRTPAARSDDHGVSARWTLELAIDGSAALTAEERHVGDAAFETRTHLGKADTRAQWVESNRVAEHWTHARLSSDVSFEQSTRDGASRLRYRAESSAIARREGRDLVLALQPRRRHVVDFAALPTRSEVLELPAELAPSHDVQTIEIAAPPGFRIVELPPEDQLPCGGLGSARQRFLASARGDRVTVERSLRFDAVRITPRDYSRWRTWMRDVDRMFSRSLRFAPRKAAPEVRRAPRR